MTPFKGKHFLVTGGSPREVIDGVRHFLNQGRDQDHASRAALALIASGAKVTLVTAKSSPLPTSSELEVIEFVDGRKIVSTADLIAACEQQSAVPYDAVIQLANIPGFVPAVPSDRKLKLKSDPDEAVHFAVRGNVNVMALLHRLFPETSVLGYSNQQEWMVSDGDLVTEAIQMLINQPQNEQSALRRISLSGGKSPEPKGRKAIVTSGPTVEIVTQTGDVITNFSSGRQGHAVAEALALMGVNVTLVAGPTHIAVPDHVGVRVVEVGSAQEMHDAVMSELPADIFVGVAAVGDFRPLAPLTLSLLEGQAYTLQLRQNPDILQAVGTHATLRPPVVVGFAAETNDLLTYARGKLARKGADLICANQVGEMMAKRSSSVNVVTFVTRAGDEEMPELSKLQVGEAIGRWVDRFQLGDSMHE